MEQNPNSSFQHSNAEENQQMFSFFFDTWCVGWQDSGAKTQVKELKQIFFHSRTLFNISQEFTPSLCWQDTKSEAERFAVSGL